MLKFSEFFNIPLPLSLWRLIFVGLSLLVSSCTVPTTVITNQSLTIELSPLTLWQERQFKGSTHYRLIESNILEAQSNGSASMLYRPIKIDLNKTPYLNWQWQISNTFKDHDEQSRIGDDFPARIYIAISPKGFSFYPRALNYVWASQAPIESHWQSPYSRDAIVLAVESGTQHIGQWVVVKRNLKADLVRYFGENIDSIEGIAIMTDSDNTGQSIQARYRSLFFSER